MMFKEKKKQKIVNEYLLVNVAFHNELVQIDDAEYSGHVNKIKINLE